MAASGQSAFEQELCERVRGDVSFDPVSLAVYSTDASIYQITPVALVLARDEQDVRAAVAVAAEHGVSILPRGGGTSLAGQAVGASMVVDTTKYMNQILELDVEQRWVRVQPGLVLDELNAALAPHRLHFAPDPATSSRATIGGMMGNNSSGTRSIIYGLTRDHVREAKVLLSDGTVLELKELSPEAYARRADGGNGRSREAEILTGFREIIQANRDEIEKRFPKIMRRVQGYNLDAFVDTDAWNLSQLLVGSEGTLGLFLEAKLNLEPLPAAKGMCVLHFADLLEAIGTVATILEHGPSAVEILDADVITRARRNLSLASICGFIEGDPKAVLLVEFFADTPAEANAKAENLARALQAERRGYAWPVMTTPAGQTKVWAVRKSGLGLMLGMKGDRKPLPFIEDACVPVDVLPEYIDQVLRFCAARDVPVAMYAHASVGLIHVRPVLDLRVQCDIDHLKAIADFAFGLVTGYGGSWSGEHGDGRVRSPYLERFFGPQIYRALRDVKNLFDPAGLMNPGPIIDPEPMDHHLRFGTRYQTPAFPTEFRFREDGSFAAAVEMCTGVGACRQNLTGTMCPSYRATRDEEHSTRGRANALRLAMTGQLGPDALTSERVHEVMDLCLSCKGCKAECPSNVDVAKLKSEFLQKYFDVHGAPRRERLVARSGAMGRWLTGWRAPIVNWTLKNRLFRKLLEKTVGLDRRRTLPAYARHPFATWFAKRPEHRGHTGKRVVLFDDTYINLHEPQVGRSAVELLESCGYAVILAEAGCCQRPRISHGFLRDARREGEKTLRNLDHYIQRGFQVVVCEPSCASALTDDLPDLIDDDQLGLRIKQNVMMIDQFLARETREGRLDCAFVSSEKDVLIHGHCHQKALYGTDAMKELLRQVDGLSVREIDSGCCGMAGSFGFEKEHYDLSLTIGEDRLFPALRDAGNGSTVVACGVSCRQQIDHATGTKPVHWVQTLRGKLPDDSSSTG